MAATKALPERQYLVIEAVVQSIYLLHGHAAPCNIHRVAVAILIILAVQTNSVSSHRADGDCWGPSGRAQYLAKSRSIALSVER